MYDSAVSEVLHLLVDRDGVLNREAEQGFILDWRDWTWEPGALTALQRLAQAAVQVSVVTNQSCIGRGLVDAGRIEELHRSMRRAAVQAGGRIDRVLMCPHAPSEGCACRKPEAGLLLQAIAESRLPASAALMVGDDNRDLEAGRRAGVAVALVRTGKGARVATTVNGDIPIFDTLLDVVESLMVSRERIG